MSITINLTKAKTITKVRLRFERQPLLEAQDILFMRAQEADASTTDIVKEKKRLREITDGVDDCTNTTQLKALKAAK
jgi:hypothetical protein